MSVNFESFFLVVDFLQNTNKNKSTWVIIVVSQIRSFVFWRKSITPENHFEINWPLIHSHATHLESSYLHFLH